MAGSGFGGLRRAARGMVGTFLVATMLFGVPGNALAVDAVYTDVASDVGISFTHSAGDLCTPPIGAGSAWSDFDNDGDPDVFITQRDNTLPNVMYQNVGDTDVPADGIPNFVDVAASAGIDDVTSYAMGATFIDIDNDGDQDLFVTGWDANRLFRNDGDIDSDNVPEYTDISATSGLVDEGRAITAAWSDYDEDGLLDVFITKHRRCGTGDNDNLDHLFHNEGGGVFTDANHELCSGASTCAEIEGFGFSPGWFDYDRDGDDDLYLVNDFISQTGAHENVLWRNDGPDGSGGWTFTDVSAASGSDTIANGMGLGVGDYDNDGFFDVAFSDIGPANVLRNVGNGTYEDTTMATGVFAATTSSTTWGTAFFDGDNDEFVDLFIAAGDIGTGGQPNFYFANNGDGTFSDQSVASGMDDGGSGLAASVVDFDQDGWVDLMVNNYAGPTVLMRNGGAAAGNTNNWLTFTVEGTDSNRDGIGTLFEVSTTSENQIRQITSGPTHGGGDYRAAYFGLGSNTSATVTVHWPNGVVESLGTVTAGQAMHLVEPTSGASGDVSVHVYEDLDGNGIEDGSDSGLAGVAVSAIDSGGGTFNATTDSSGDATLVGLDPGSATVTFTTPAGYSLSTGNAVQVVTAVDGSTVATSDVGYEPTAATTGDVSGHVFSDGDGNGVEDGADSGLVAVQVDAVDFNGAAFSTTTDGNGDYTLSGLATGSATVTFTTPSGYSLSTGNAVQVVTVVDASTVATADVGYEPLGTPPTINGIDNSTKTIDQDSTRQFRVDVSDYVDGATWSFSGNGLSVTNTAIGAGDKVRITVSASAAADPGFHDMTVTNPDGLSDTLVNAIDVIGTAPPATGDVAGHVFDDADGDGVLDAGELGLANVSVTITDSGNAITVVSTDSNGDFLATGQATGTASVDYSTPAGRQLTTGNASQLVTVVDSSTVTAADVGYQSIPSGDVAGRVFSDDDGNGVEDGAESGLAGAQVDVVDFNGSSFSTTTDANGDYSIVGLAVGDATVTFTTPAGHTLTTGNGVQVVTVVDASTVATADVGYEPPTGTPPSIDAINGNTVVAQGNTRALRVTVTNYVSGATWAFSGNGVTITAIQAGAGDSHRITISVDSNADLGSHDLVITNPDGLSDTWSGAIEVIS